jgi:hypothetical protein
VVDSAASSWSAGIALHVCVHRDGHSGVPKSFTHGLGVNPSLQGDGGVRVAKIMRPDAAEAGKPDMSVELLPETLRVHGRAVLAGTDS